MQLLFGSPPCKRYATNWRSSKICPKNMYERLEFLLRQPPGTIGSKQTMHTKKHLSLCHFHRIIQQQWIHPEAPLSLYHNSYHTRSQDLNRYERLQAHTKFMCSPPPSSPGQFEYGTLSLRMSSHHRPLHLVQSPCGKINVISYNVNILPPPSPNHKNIHNHN